MTAMNEHEPDIEIGNDGLTNSLRSRPEPPGPYSRGRRPGAHRASRRPVEKRTQVMKLGRVTLVVGLILWALLIFTAIYHPLVWAIIAGLLIAWGAWEILSERAQT